VNDSKTVDEVYSARFHGIAQFSMESSNPISCSSIASGFPSGAQIEGKIQKALDLL
jgi:hypothetical protein